MAVVDYNSLDWTNDDGLKVYFGAGEAVETKAGEYQFFGGTHCTEVILDLLALSTAATAASGNEVIIADNVLIPNGAFIERVEVFVLKETAGANANLDLGLVDQDRSTEIDFNGLLAAADAFNAGTDLGGVHTFQKLDGTLTTEGGALIGTKITNTGILTASADTADWTAGVLRIRIYWYVPLSGDL
jgi:hypothetical protein